jgi:hypothetical protein
VVEIETRARCVGYDDSQGDAVEDERKRTQIIPEECFQTFFAHRFDPAVYRSPNRACGIPVWSRSMRKMHPAAKLSCLKGEGFSG